MEESFAEVGGTGGSGLSLESRPGVLFLGAPNVGKRTLVSRLTSIDLPEADDLCSGTLCQGWTIETKYYTADISLWIAHLDEQFSLWTLPTEKLIAVVLVFDMSEESSIRAIKSFVAHVDISNFEILLCVGNKVDLVPGHHAHQEFRRRMHKQQCVSTEDPLSEYSEFGIDETEAFSLLGEVEPSIGIRQSSLDWCLENNIEYIESCASSADFDKCLSVDGDVQGVERIWGALSAHMWQGMVLKSGHKVISPFLAEKEESVDDDDSDYDFEYEVLLDGPDEACQPNDEAGSASAEQGLHDFGPYMDSGASTSAAPNNSLEMDGDRQPESRNVDLEHAQDCTDQPSSYQTSKESSTELTDDAGGFSGDEHYGYDDLERLMLEIGNVRDNLRLLPDFQRREMAAKLAMKMANMFGDTKDDDSDDDKAYDS